jgi:hypothetical protein
MAINQNHLFEDLNGVKCAIVEKNVNPGRVEFLKELLEGNKFEVVVVPSPPPKTVAVPTPKPAAIAEGDSPAVGTVINDVSIVPEVPIPETFTVGVTDVVFNPTNAIFGRLLRTPDGHVVTMSYWQQDDKVSHDDIPYYESSF